MMRAFVAHLRQRPGKRNLRQEEVASVITALDESLESREMAFAGEVSRIAGEAVRPEDVR